MANYKFQVNTGGDTNIITYNNVENFNKYLNEIAKLRPLSREEEVAIFKEIERTGDKRLIDKICKHNMLFVVAVARKVYNLHPTISSLTFEDLVSEGNMGLCTAIQKFDYTTGNKFISYAVWHIKQQMLACIQNHLKTIRIPSSARKIVNSYNKREAILEQRFGRTPTTVEVFEELLKSDELSVTYDVAKLDELMKMNRFETSLNDLISARGSSPSDKTEIGELIENDDPKADEQYIQKERHQLLYDLIEKLPRHIKAYFTDYYGLNGTPTLDLKEMGLKYDEEPHVIKHRMDKYLLNLRHINRSKKEFFFPAPDYDEVRMLRGRDKDTIYLI